jgi:aspartyl-tRNA(Asn)/glutamyl-tRNA(Gln) amidotransferase subunit C
MPLPRDEVAEIALLARLHLSADETARMQDELGAILDNFKSLAAVDTTGIVPLTHPVPMDLRLRGDVALPSLPVEDALAAAPARDGDFIVVPAIIPGAES